MSKLNQLQEWQMGECVCKNVWLIPLHIVNFNICFLTWRQIHGSQVNRYHQDLPEYRKPTFHGNLRKLLLQLMLRKDWSDSECRETYVTGPAVLLYLHTRMLSLHCMMFSNLWDKEISLVRMGGLLTDHNNGIFSGNAA